MPIRYAPGELDNAIEQAIDSFEDLRVDAILERVPDEDGPEMDRATSLQSLGEQLEGVSETLLGDVSELVASSWAEARAIVEHATNRATVIEALQIALARRHAIHTREMAERCFDITRDVLPHLPDSLAAQYLRLLTRCYVAGYYPEATMLAGSVLEQEIRAVFERKGIPLPETPSGRAEMKTRIAAARQFRWLSDNGQRAAETVWLRRNKTTHNDPAVSSKCLETVRLTILVLQELTAVQ